MRVPGIVVLTGLGAWYSRVAPEWYQQPVGSYSSDIQASQDDLLQAFTYAVQSFGKPRGSVAVAPLVTCSARARAFLELLILTDDVLTCTGASNGFFALLYHAICCQVCGNFPQIW